MLSIGLIGILVELWNPGLVFPGTVGAISLIVGLYGLQVLPVSAAGVLLMLLAAGFFIAEAFVPSHGALRPRGRDVRDRLPVPLRPCRRRIPGVPLDAIGIAVALALLLGVALTASSRRVKTRSRSASTGWSAAKRSCGATAGAGGRRALAGAHRRRAARPWRPRPVEAVQDDLGLVVGSLSPDRKAD